MPRRSRQRSGSRGRSGYYWDGLQWPLTTIAATPGTAFEIIGPTAQEFMPGTLVRCRGQIVTAHAADSPVQGMLKLMYVEFNDAGAMSGDHKAIDTHEEDIAARMIWTDTFAFRDETDGSQTKDKVDIDVKVKVKLSSGGKHGLVLLAEADVAARVSITGFLRALILHA